MWIWIKKIRIESWLFVCSLQQMRTTIMGRWTTSLVHHWQETQRKGWSHVTSPPPSLCCWPSISPPSLVRVGICIDLLRCAAGHLFPLHHWWELVYVLTSFVVLLAIYFPSITGESWYMYWPPSLCCWPSISPPSLVTVGICIHHFLPCAAGHLFPLHNWWQLVYVFTTSFLVLLAIYFPSITGDSWYIYVFTTSFLVLLAIYFPSITGDSWYMYSPLPSLCCWPSISHPSLVTVGICIHHFLPCAAGHLFPLHNWWQLVYVFTTSFLVLPAIYFPSIASKIWYLYIHLVVVQIVSVIRLSVSVSPFHSCLPTSPYACPD